MTRKGEECVVHFIWRLKPNDAPTQRNGDCFGTVTGTKLFHDVLDMSFYRFFTDEELHGNVDVAITPCNFFENLNLPRTYIILAKMLRKLGGNLWRHITFPVVDFTDCVQKLGARHSLQ